MLIVFGGPPLLEAPQDATQIVFESSVIGLESGADVYLNGIRVGSVKRVGIDAGGPAARARRDRGRGRHAGPHRHARVLSSSAGITGLKVIDLRRRRRTTAGALPADAIIPVGPGTLDKLEKQAEDVADQADAADASRRPDRSTTPTRSSTSTLPMQVTDADSALGAIVEPRDAGADLDAIARESRADDPTRCSRENQAAAKTTTGVCSIDQIGELASNASDVIDRHAQR